MASYSWRLLAILILSLLVSCTEEETLAIDYTDIEQYSEPDVTAEVECSHMRWEEYTIACDGILDSEVIDGYIIIWLGDFDARLCAYQTTFSTGITLMDEVFGNQVEEGWGCVTLSDYSEILPWSRTPTGVWVEWEGQRIELFAPDQEPHRFPASILYWRNFHIAD